MIDEAQIENWFTYHAPTRDQQVNYETLRNHGREFAHIINNLVPDGPDKTAAMRKLREVVMTANAAIATSPVSVPKVAPARAKATKSPYQTVDTGKPEVKTWTTRDSNGRFTTRPAVKKAAAPRPTTMGDLVDQFRSGRGI